MAFGSMLGQDRKMFRTRAGEVVKLVDLLDEAVVRAAAAVEEKNPELSPAERAVVARMVVAIVAVRMERVVVNAQEV